MNQSNLKRIRLWLLVLVELVSVALSGTNAVAFSRSKFLAVESPVNIQEPKQADIAELMFGVPVERELAGGGIHSYRVSLAKGQYMQVVVEQKGIDVVVRLFGPDGKQISEVDSPNGTQGPEPLVMIAEIDGEYRLEVGSLEQQVAPGRYEVKIHELRQATARDRERTIQKRALDQVLAEAELLKKQGTAESLKRAIEKYNEALPLLKTLENRLVEARTINAIGSLYWQLGDYQKAQDYNHQGLSLTRALGDRVGEAESLNNIGTVYWQSGDSRKALDYYNQALPVWRVLHDRQSEAMTLNNIGLAFANLGELDAALDHHTQGLALTREIAFRREESRSLNNIANIYYRLGKLQNALEYYHQALELNSAIENRRQEGVILSNIGNIYWQVGDFQKALEYNNKALSLRRATGDRAGEIVTLHNFGTVYGSLGEWQKALSYYEQALTLARAMGERRQEGITLSQIGGIYLQLNDTQKALDFLNQGLAIRRASGDRAGEAITLSKIGAVYNSLHNPGEALAYLNQAILLSRAVGDKSSEAVTLQHLARAERDRGHFDEARKHIETAVDIIESTRSQLVSQQLRTFFSGSRQDFYELYIDLLMRMHKRQPMVGYDQDALQISERARARGLLEILNESHADIRQGIDVNLLEREKSLRQRLSSKSERLARLLSSKHTDEQETAARNEVETLLAEFEGIEAQIRAKSPRYAALTQPQTLTLKGIQGLLDKDTTLLEYALGEERSYLWVVTPTSIKSFDLPKRADIEDVARRTYDLLATRNQTVKFEEASERGARIAKADAEYQQIAGVLSRTLLGPVTDAMKSKRLLFVGDGILQYIPFAALPLPDALEPRRQATYVPLIARYEVVNLPSASTLAVIRKELAGRKPAPKMVAVLADPVFDNEDERVKASKSRSNARRQVMSKTQTQSDASLKLNELTRSVRDVTTEEDESLLPLPRLPFTRQEADAVVALAPTRQYEKATDFAASRKTALDPRLGEYRYVHFATHAILNSRHPELSGIVLSLVNQEGNAQDGFFLAHEAYNLNLPAELIVLSGCRTGLGKEVRGEGILSLTRGFMYAGGARVVVSLWDVNDKSTAELMAHLYEGMLGKQSLSPAAALRQAQIAMWRSARWRAPYYWAAFTMHGEYR